MSAYSSGTLSVRGLDLWGNLSGTKFTFVGYFDVKRFRFFGYFDGKRFRFVGYFVGYEI